MADNYREDIAVLPLAEEILNVEIRETLTGRFRIRTVTDTMDNVVQQALRREDIEIKQIPIDRYIESGADEPRTRQENGVTIIPVFEEVLVVEKRLLLKHEIHVRHMTRMQTSEVPISLRKQRAIIERLNSEGEATADPIKIEESPK